MWEALSRLGLVVTWTAVTLMLAYIGWRREGARPYVWAFAPLALVNVVFYVFSWLYRLGLFIPPAPFFFSDMSNYRTWATVITSFIVLAPTVWELWTGQTSS